MAFSQPGALSDAQAPPVAAPPDDSGVARSVLGGALAALTAGGAAAARPERWVPRDARSSPARQVRPMNWWERLYLPEIARGLLTTLKHLFRKPVTVPYPFAKSALAPRFRGVHRLKKNEWGEEKCVACLMCSTACPAECITIVPEAAPASYHQHDATRDKHPRVFTIDLLRCIYCGMCEEACPCDAIELTARSYPQGRSRADFIYDKARLLETPATKPMTP